jgi:flagellar capping protein FliD
MNDECTCCSDVIAENDRLDDENTSLRTELNELQARYDALKNTALDTHDNILAQLNTLDGVL